MLERLYHNRIMMAASLLIIMIILAGCASQPAAQPAKTASAAGSNATPASGSSAATANISFAKDIQPILQNSCISCHGGDRTSRGLDMKTYMSLIAGSQNGAVIIPGNAANSLFIKSVESGQMPKRGSPLPDAQINLLVEWVNAGAKNN